LSAARLGAGGWSLAAVIVAAFTHAAWSLANVDAADLATARAALAGQAALGGRAAAWPLLPGGRLRKSAWAVRAGAPAGPIGFVGLYQAWSVIFGKGAIGLLPVALGFVTFAVAWRARTLILAEGGVRRTALAWLFAITLAAVSLAIPLQLENEWVTVGW